MQAIWEDRVIADSERCIEVEGNQYFPVEDVDMTLLRPSDKETVCSWKGTARYYDVAVGTEINRDAAWYYPAPFDARRSRGASPSGEASRFAEPRRRSADLDLLWHQGEDAPRRKLVRGEHPAQLTHPRG